MAVAVSQWPRRRVAAQVRPHIAACVLGRPHTPAPPRHPSAPPAPPPSLTASYPRSPRSPSHLPAQQPAHNPTAPPRERRTIPTMPATQRTAAQSSHRAHEPGPHGCFWPWRSGERAEKPTKANTRVHTRTAPPRRAPLPAPPVHADAPCSPFHPPALPQPPPPVSTVDPSFLPLGPHTRSLLTVHQMSAGQQIRGSGWQWRVGTGEQSSRLMLGWGVVAEGVQDGRKCRSSMAACLHGCKCQRDRRDRLRSWNLPARLVVSLCVLAAHVRRACLLCVSDV